MAATSALEEVVGLASELIAIDTTNYGHGHEDSSERAAAEYVAEKLTEVGFDVTYVESEPRRASVVARLAGSRATADALLVHGHLDVVPADASEWSVPPFSGRVAGGHVWGRGAVDMKGMLAMTLAVARSFKRNGVVPRRDLIFAFLADEEAGGFLGSRWLVENRPELFEGATTAISEVGGFSVTLENGTRAYLVGTAEKGGALARLTTRGVPGHASLRHRDSAIARLARAITAVDEHEFPVVISDTVRRLARGIAGAVGHPYREEEIRDLLGRLGPASKLLLPTLRDTANVTMLRAGYKSNVVPSEAEAVVDGRMLPGREAAFESELRQAVGDDVAIDVSILPGLETPYEGPVVDAIGSAIAAEDPGSVVLPFLIPGGTDAKAFAALGISTYGFSPLQLPPELDFAALFHGIDERVPVAALHFGTRVLHRMLAEV